MATHPVDSDHLLANLSWRYAVKKFDSTRKIPQATWKTLERGTILAPSSYGLQPWRMLVVTDPEVRVRLRAAAWNQSQITDASHLVVFARRKVVSQADIETYVQQLATVRKTTLEAQEDFKQMMLRSVANPSGLPGGSMDTYTRSQTYIALAFFLYTAAQLNIDACPMEGFEPAKFDEILGLPAEGFAASVVATAGYRATDDWLAGLAKVRPEPAQIIKYV